MQQRGGLAIEGAGAGAGARRARLEEGEGRVEGTRERVRPAREEPRPLLGAAVVEHGHGRVHAPDGLGGRGGARGGVGGEAADARGNGAGGGDGGELQRSEALGGWDKAHAKHNAVLMGGRRRPETQRAPEAGRARCGVLQAVADEGQGGAEL